MFTAAGLDEIIKEMSAAEEEVWVLQFQKLRTHGLSRRTQEVEGNPQESMGT